MSPAEQTAFHQGQLARIQTNKSNILATNPYNSINQPRQFAAWQAGWQHNGKL